MRRQPCCGGFICVVYLVAGEAAGRQLRTLPHCQGVPGPCRFCHEHGGLHGDGLGPRRGTASTCWGYCEILGPACLKQPEPNYHKGLFILYFRLNAVLSIYILHELQLKAHLQGYLKISSLHLM